MSYFDDIVGAFQTKLKKDLAAGLLEVLPKKEPAKPVHVPTERFLEIQANAQEVMRPGLFVREVGFPRDPEPTVLLLFLGPGSNPLERNVVDVMALEKGWNR